jgi:hypothetical protein
VTPPRPPNGSGGQQRRPPRACPGGHANGPEGRPQGWAGPIPHLARRAATAGKPRPRPDTPAATVVPARLGGDAVTAKKPDLADVVSHLLDECRMVLPGIQALFGFQLVAVFNQRFEQIPFGHQVVHLAATGLVALSAALVMAPAAYHRSVEPQGASERFVRLSTRLLLLGMLLLATAVSVDFFVISSMILDSPVACTLVSCTLFTALAALWFVFPNWKRACTGAPRRGRNEVGAAVLGRQRASGGPVPRRPKRPGGLAPLRPSPPPPPPTHHRAVDGPVRQVLARLAPVAAKTPFGDSRGSSTPLEPPYLYPPADRAGGKCRNWHPAGAGLPLVRTGRSCR